MKYSANKIYLSCDEATVREWAGYMLDHLSEVVQSLAQENVRHEMWLLGRDGDALYLIGVMDVDDAAQSQAIAGKSTLSVDRVHREFKRHWRFDTVERLTIDPAETPRFPGCDLLFEARP